jgi:hypothetical protein
LGVNVRFEDRIYKLGDTIDLALELSPRRDIEIREGSVELVCEENWTEVTTVLVRPKATTLGPPGTGRVVFAPPQSKQVSKKDERPTYTVRPSFSATGVFLPVERTSIAPD